ncbi:GPI mannosyltransferase 3 [Chionoecetes opilio]|uniref:Mannosyltransferase n=1 Tax=Chionoecetes opilio TaxID=41210 RepID=A0A8J4XVR4_CHIOP|nr:GPI mannosyltransferase 3 [Chionoecetes opilio]
MQYLVTPGPPPPHSLITASTLCIFMGRSLLVLLRRPRLHQAGRDGADTLTNALCQSSSIALAMYEWPLLVVLAVRVASVPLVQTWFVPDEYWQATEVAHAMAFRYGYKTWEWREGIRGALYPASFAALFKVMFFLGADTPALLCFSWMDSSVPFYSLVLELLRPTHSHLLCGTVLLAVAFSHYPWRRERDSPSAKYLWPVGLACAIRPTAAVPFLPLAVRHLCHSSCRGRLLLHYSLITTVIVAVTVGVDSWYYGELVVVPWRFVHFNVVTGLSSHYGILPWHWYLSQGLPATLTTHVLPLVAALVSQPSRHRDLLPVILWSLLVYSCLGHKEFRFLLPLLPLCLCIAGDHIAFHLAAHAKKTGDSSRLRRTVVFLVLLIPNLTALVYLGLIHQRGPLDTMQILRQEIEVNPRASILFLMPCHSTPYYSHLHSNVTMRFLTCEPNLKFEAHYMDEADLFEKDPHAWLQQELGASSQSFQRPFQPVKMKEGTWERKIMGLETW